MLLKEKFVNLLVCTGKGNQNENTNAVTWTAHIQISCSLNYSYFLRLLLTPTAFRDGLSAVVK